MVTFFFVAKNPLQGVQRDILVVVGSADAVDGGSHIECCLFVKRK